MISRRSEARNKRHLSSSQLSPWIIFVCFTNRKVSATEDTATLWIRRRYAVESVRRWWVFFITFVGMVWCLVIGLFCSLWWLGGHSYVPRNGWNDVTGFIFMILFHVPCLWLLKFTKNRQFQTANGKQKCKQIILLYLLYLELTFANSWNCEISPPTSDFVPRLLQNGCLCRWRLSGLTWTRISSGPRWCEKSCRICHLT